MACTMVNDIYDVKEDSASGKDRWISNLPRSHGTLIVIIVLIMGLLSIISAKPEPGIIISYVAAIFLGSFYSIEPVRFKERGILGLFAYSLSVAIIYVLVPWILFKSGIILLSLIFPAVMLDKWVNLHFHQIVDYRGDLNAGIGTYAVRVGIERTRRSLRLVSFLASLSMIIAIVFILLLFKREIIWWTTIMFISIVVVASTGIYIKIQKEGPGDISDLVRKLPWLYLGLTYLLLRILPPVIFTYLALREAVIWILVIISILSLIGESLYMIRYKYE